MMLLQFGYFMTFFVTCRLVLCSPNGDVSSFEIRLHNTDKGLHKVTYTGSVRTDGGIEKNVPDAESLVSGESKRKRRNIFKTTGSLLRGLIATKRLLSGARKMFTSKAYTQYEKGGGHDQALRDFLSVRPTEVLDQGGLKSGKIGDRRITLTLGKDPVVTIFIPKRFPSKTIDQIVDSIIYRTYQ